MPDFYQNYPSKNFIAGLQESSLRLSQLGNGAMAGREYERMVKRLREYAYQKTEPLVFENLRQTRLALAVLTQESDTNDLLSVLIEKNKFEAVILSALKYVDTIEKAQIKRAFEKTCQSLLLLYYRRYFSFERGVCAETAREVLLEPLKIWIANYTGRNRMVLTAKAKPALIHGDLSGVLKKFDDDVTLQEIQKTLCLDTHFEIFIRLRLLRLLVKIKALQANQYDDGVSRLFVEIKENKDVRANEQRSLVEESVHIMVGLCQVEGQICKEWQQFIFETIGDPRASKNHFAWQRVGEEKRNWFVGVLSRGDLREFLETMTDGQGDEVYQYRKQFWLQYVDHAINAKIMLGNNAYYGLQRQNPDMWQRFKTSPETYSRLEDTERSCVFIDFGTFKVIEGTHSAKLRVYIETPIDLSARSYQYQEFYHLRKNRPVPNVIKEFSHYESQRYSWQNRVRNYLNKNFQINPSITLASILLPDEQNDRSIAQIRNHLSYLGQNVN